MSRKIHKRVLIAVVCLWALVGTAYTVNAQPAAMAPAMRPAAMTVARPAPKPVAVRPVVMRAAPRPALRPAARPAPMHVAAMPAAAPASTMTAPVPAMVAAPTMEAPAAAMAPAKPAAAPAVKKDTKGQVVGGWILQVLLYLLGIFLTAFIPVFTAWLYKKFKLTDLQHKDKLDEIALKAAMIGIGKADEAAYKLRDNPMDSAKKLDLAIASANKYLVDSGLPEKGAQYLADLIESKLGETRGGSSKPAEKPAEAPKVEDKPEDKPKEGGDK